MQDIFSLPLSVPSSTEELEQKKKKYGERDHINMFFLRFFFDPTELWASHTRTRYTYPYKGVKFESETTWHLLLFLFDRNSRYIDSRGEFIRLSRQFECLDDLRSAMLNPRRGKKPPKDIRVHESQESSLFPCTHNCRTIFSLRTKFFGNVNVTASSNVRAVKNDKFFGTFLSIPIPFNLFSGKHHNTIVMRDKLPSLSSKALGPFSFQLALT